ncbi:protein Daple [Hyalella azteca]|uniref:Protein Daple n=1 Tax=Hyalella azteca TaxID=294128 RepID=A0A8B7PE59_HYAAZ|nr:protein Daple [Hyalella azteca]
MSKKEEKEAAKTMKRLTEISLEYERLYKTLMESTAGQRVLEFEPTLRRGLREKDDEILALNKKLKQTSKELVETTAEIKAVKRIIGSMEAHLSRYTGNRDASFRRVSPEESSRATLSRSEAIQLHSLIQAYDELLDDKTQHVRDAVQKLEKVRDEQLKLNDENQLLRTHLKSIHLEEHVRAELEEENKILRSKVSELQPFTVKVRELQQQQDELKQKLAASDAHIKRATEDTQEWKQKYLESEKRLATSYSPQQHDASLDECRKHLDQCKARLQDQQKEAAELQSAMELQAEKLSAAEQTVKKLTQSLNEKDKLVKRRTRKISKGEALHKIMERKLSKLNGLCRTLANERAALLIDLDALARTKKNLQQEARKSSATIGTINQRLENDHLILRTQIAELTGAYLQARKALRTSVKESTMLREQCKKKDRYINDLLNEFRFLGLNEDRGSRSRYPA